MSRNSERTAWVLYYGRQAWSTNLMVLERMRTADSADGVRRRAGPLAMHSESLNPRQNLIIHFWNSFGPPLPPSNVEMNAVCWGHKRGTPRKKSNPMAEQ